MSKDMEHKPLDKETPPGPPNTPETNLLDINSAPPITSSFLRINNDKKWTKESIEGFNPDFKNLLSETLTRRTP